MATERDCRRVRDGLEEALFSRDEIDGAAREHLAKCPDCTSLAAQLRHLATALDALPAPEPPPELLATTLARARTALATRDAVTASPPEGFGGELLRVFAGAAAVLPIVVLWNWAVLAFGEELLAPFLPAPLLAVLAAGWVLAASGWLALLYGSIPFLAHHRAVRRLNEVTP